MFKSDLGDAIIIDDTNYKSFVKPVGDDGSASGYIPRDHFENPLGSYAGSAPLPPGFLIPRDEWKERIEEMERTKTRVSDLLLRAPDEWLNQYNTNYCWCYAVIHAVMIARFLAGFPWERLSPYSVACIIKNFQNRGGWGSQAIAQIVKTGIASEKFWPMETPSMGQSAKDRANKAAIFQGRQYLEPSREDAAKRKVELFYDLGDRKWDAKMSCLLRRLPVASGYSWMGHEMCSIDPVILPNGDVGCLDMDHYGSNGKYNRRVMSSSRGNADDAVVPVISAPQFDK
jgi:hypothetical protein